MGFLSVAIMHSGQHISALPKLVFHVGTHMCVTNSANAIIVYLYIYIYCYQFRLYIDTRHRTSTSKYNYAFEFQLTEPINLLDNWICAVWDAIVKNTITTIEEFNNRLDIRCNRVGRTLTLLTRGYDAATLTLELASKLNEAFPSTTFDIQIQIWPSQLTRSDCNAVT